MRTRMFFLLLAVVLSACTSQLPRSTDDVEPAAPAPGGVLLLGSNIGVKSVDPVTGDVLFEGSGVPALGDWSRVFTTDVSGGATTLEASDAVTGALVSRVSLPGKLSARVAAGDGSLVALMAPLADGRSPWIPEPRSSTTIVVADPTGDDEPTPYRLRGNFEPEAFSTDGESLYLIRFVPPMDPVAYRVARLDLGRGKVLPVGTRTKSAVVETMSGTRLEQLPSPDGDMLYTLYTTQPAAYAEGHAHVGSPVTFVHTLSMDEGWAHCVVLPKQLWGADPVDEAMALSPDGDLLYVVDTARDLVAVMDTEDVKVIENEKVDFEPARGAETQAIVTPDGTLFVAAGSQVWALDPAALRPVETWTMEAPVAALGSGPGGLYVAMPRTVTIIDPSTGKAAASIPSPAVEDTAFVGMVARS
ncbi:MAG TPA: hypothetical protein VGS09_10940 [Actinomycetota bacterium]|nr:hypothetical protein [Actinomycetota bacterium]